MNSHRIKKTLHNKTLLLYEQGTRVLRDFQRRKYQRLKWQEKRNNGERVVTAGTSVRREKGSKEKSQIFTNGGELFSSL